MPWLDSLPTFAAIEKNNWSIAYIVDGEARTRLSLRRRNTEAGVNVT
jgi:hypothetical protein